MTNEIQETLNDIEVVDNQSEAPSIWSTRHGIDAIYGHLPPHIYDHIYANKELADLELIKSLIQNFSEDFSQLKATVLRNGEVEVDGLKLLNEVLASEDLQRYVGECFKSMAKMAWKVKNNDFLPAEEPKARNLESPKVEEA